MKIKRMAIKVRSLASSKCSIIILWNHYYQGFFLFFLFVCLAFLFFFEAGSLVTEAGLELLIFLFLHPES